ncbi:MAG: hypothetical protein H0V47_01420 [Chloroflexia bacterium]|jgi:hypothetical protein|nr:hypothetical protein [Chloroflexia bacterium]
MGNDMRTARNTIGLFRLWFGYLGGAVVWSVFHLVSYLWASAFCGTSAEILLNLTTIVTALITLAATIVCYRNWQKLKSIEPESSGTFRFLLLSGVFMNSLFLLTIVVSGIAVWILGTCA